MTILPPMTIDQLTPEQRRVWDIVTAGRRGSAAELIDETGGLIGPFNALLYSPVIGERVAALGEAIRFDSALDRRLIEVATITVAARWRSVFEWWIHARLAREAGVPEETIERIQRGEDPGLDERDEEGAVVHRFVVELLADGRPRDETYASLTAALGESGAVEIVNLVGYYCIISFILNTFQVGIPPGEPVPWKEGEDSFGSA